jgi:hypothetical protein
MHYDTGGQKQRAGFLAAAMTGIALLAAACGSGSPTTTGSPAKESATYQQALTFTRCLRTHGEPTWPDPTSQGNFNISQIDIRSPSYMRSFSDCAFLRPAGIKLQESAAQRTAASRELAKFAACMRSHGYPDFSTPGFGKRVLHLSSGIDPTSQSFPSAMKRCGAVTYHGGWSIPAA